MSAATNPDERASRREGRYRATEEYSPAGALLRNFIHHLINRLSEIRPPSVRPLLAPLRAVIGAAIDRLGEIRPPSMRPLVASLGAVIGGVVDRLGALELRRGRRWDMAEAALDHFGKRLGAVRWRLRVSRLGRSADGVIVVPLLGAVLALGVFTATAATRGSSDTGTDLSSTARQVSPSVTEAEVVTETITRDGETIRVIRKRPGRVVTISGRSVTLPGDSVTLPGSPITLPGQTHTVVKTDTRTRTVTNTVTTQQTATVTETQTQTQTETETVTETVTEPGNSG